MRWLRQKAGDTLFCMTSCPETSSSSWSGRCSSLTPSWLCWASEFQKFLLCVPVFRYDFGI